MNAEELIKKLTDINSPTYTIRVNGREVVDVDKTLYNGSINLVMEAEKFDALDPGEYL